MDPDDPDELLCSEVMRPSSSSPVYDQQICCLLDSGRRCEKIAGNASYNKRVQKIVGQKNLRLTRDENAHHLYICDQHKSIIQSVRAKRKRRESPATPSASSLNVAGSSVASETQHLLVQQSVHTFPVTQSALPTQPPLQILSPSHPSSIQASASYGPPSQNPVHHFSSEISSLTIPSPAISQQVDPGPEIDWNSLPLNALRRYRKFFKLQTASSSGKSSLADAVNRDFKTLPVSEKEILTYFIYMIKTGASKLDQEGSDSSK
ncbi:unnamed protein product [Cyprideis torosa]|uniref:Uncharacterized protein n=1 Tax=Cyprideis torosa TaxID=163714 RepID=A0A7R8ZWC9_9CRUS|nr:unnamed protein product [Cyprideis torosa]CAG0904680.1 unnamed protein product [Cyprideis torosa]